MLPHRQVAVCRELTKLHEEIVRGDAQQVHDEFAQRDSVRGEIVIVIDAPSEADQVAAAADAREQAQARAAQLVAEGVRPKQIARMLADELGIPRNEAYELALEARA